MIDKKNIELINKDIDGEITTIEQQRLHSFLNANPEAQKFHDKLRQISELLNKIPKVEPSPNIKKYVMNSIDLTRYSTAKKRIRFRSIFSSLFFKPIPKLAYTFALGILVGILVYSVLLENVISKRGMDVTDFYGTVGINEQAGFTTIQNIPIALPEIKGTISVKRLENIVVFETDMHSLKEMEIQFEYDNLHLQFSHFNSGSQAKMSFDFGENYIRTSCTGAIQYSLFFNELAAAGNSVILKLFVAGEVCYMQSISL
jgi:hypothetical protein